MLFPIHRQRRRCDRRTPLAAPARSRLLGKQIQGTLNPPELFAQDIAPGLAHEPQLPRQGIRVSPERRQQILRQASVIETRTPGEESGELLEGALRHRGHLETLVESGHQTSRSRISTLEPEQDQIKNEALRFRVRNRSRSRLPRMLPSKLYRPRR